MKELVTTMTSGGQITVPDEVQRVLGLRPNDKVAFAINAGKVRLVPVTSTIDEVFSSVEPLHDQSLDDQIRAAKEARAERIARTVATP